MGVYGPIQGAAKSLITKFGQVIVLTRHARSTLGFDPIESEFYPTSLLSITGSSVNVSFSSKEIDGTNILRGDVKASAVFDSPSLVPAVGDVITDGDTAYNIMSVEALSPGGVDILYTLQLRK
jgi:hypothetical protein